MKSIKVVALFVLLIFSFHGSVFASDMLREKRMADEIVDATVDGEALFLKSNNIEFLSIYTEADDSKGVAIILHGRGFHPD